MDITAVLVTYNRLELLKESLGALLNQTVPLSKIVIVNNASTDGTKEYLKEMKKIYHNIIIISLKKNLGGSGGFYHGMKYASSLDTNWILLLDDDAILNFNFVEEIAVNIKKYPKIQAFCGVVKNNGKLKENFQRGLIKNKVFYRLQPVSVNLYKGKNFKCDTFSFVGVVICNEIVKKIGLPEKRYFIWGDDLEYSLRVRNNTNILNINTAIINHKCSEENKELSWKTYYGERNQIITKKKYIENRLLLFLYYIYKFLKNIYIIIKGRRNFRIKFNLYMTSYLDGVKGKKGINKKYYPGKIII